MSNIIWPINSFRLKNVWLIFILLVSCGQNTDKTSNLTTEENIRPDSILNQTSLRKEIPSKRNYRYFEPTSIDTFLDFSEELSLQLKYSDSTTIQPYYRDQKIIDSLTKPYGNFYKRAQVIENYRLQTFGDQVKRSGDTILTRLTNGNWASITPNHETDEAGNTFEYYFKEEGFYLIRTQWSEGSEYKLISHLDGRITPIWGVPYFSPDSRYMISVNGDIDAGYSPNGFQLFKLNSGRLKLMGSFEPVKWEPGAAEWTDNQTMKIRCRTTEIKNDLIHDLFFYIALHIN